jgi:hypothetical protein
MDKQLDLDVQLALACLMFLPHSMRGSRTAAMLTEAMRDPELARELQNQPRAVFERRCGLVIPAATNIEVHFSTTDSIQLVLPISAVSEQLARIEAEITDADLLSEGLKVTSPDLTGVAKEPPGDAYVKPRK